MHLTALCSAPPPAGLTKIWRVMKLTALILLTAFLHVSAATSAQNVTLSEKNMPLEKVLTEIHKQTGYEFLYNVILFQRAKPVDLSVNNLPVSEVLNIAFRDQPFTYIIIDNKTIVVKQKDEPKIENNIPPPGDIRGRVTDSAGAPLAGASVTVKGEKKGVETDAGGNFILKGTESSATLVISFTGYIQQEIKLAGRANIYIRLSQGNNPLDEVQIIAYGTTTRRLSVGNVGTVSSKTISMQNVTNPLLAIQGQVPGLYITQASGIPGSTVTVMIQGQNSINKGNDPLYVVDGVPYPAQNAAALTANAILGFPIPGGYSAPNGAGSPLSYINPSDIESISVLKDADATSVYGSLAANGAIIITTKKGKPGDTKLDLIVQQGWGKVSHFMPLMNTQQYLDMRYQALRNSGATVGPNDFDLNGSWGDINRYTDWQKVLMGGTSQYNNDNISISGGTNNVQYLISGTYHRATTVFPGNGADTYGAMHFSLDTRSVNNKFKMQFTGSYQSDDNQLPSGNVNLVTTALKQSPNSPALYNADGTLNWQISPTLGASLWINPLGYLHRPFRIKSNPLVANSILSYTILPGLDIKSSFGYNLYQNNSYTLNESQSLDPVTAQASGTDGRAAFYTTSQVNTWIIEPQLTFHRIIGKGTLNVLIGTTIRQSGTQALQEFGQGYASDALLQDVYSAAKVTVNSSNFATYKYNALYGRLGYNWDNRYILDLTARRDGSSRFGANNEFHNFWSAGVAWIFSETKYLKNNLPWFSFGKFRLSYGTTGSDQIGDYQYLNLYNSLTPGIAYQDAPAYGTGILPNPNLQWELTKKLQGGVSLVFFNDRISLDVVYALNRSSNELLSGPLPAVTGNSYIAENLPATVQNTQWEFTLNTINIKVKDFRWRSSFNLTVPRNKLVSTSASILGALGPHYIVGQPIGLTFVYHFMGVDPATGKYVVADSQGNPTSNPSATTDNTIRINTVFPAFYGGFQNNFQYKNFGLDFMFRFVKKIASNYAFGPTQPGFRLVNQPTYVIGAWQKPGDISKIQRYDASNAIRTSSSAGSLSDAAYSDASFIRLQYISMSYTLPQAWLSRAHIRNIRLFAQGENVFTITKFKGLDPETGNSALPPLRVITFGLDLGL